MPMRALFNAGMVGKRLALAACLGLVVSGSGPATAADLQALPPLQLDVLEPQVKATLSNVREHMPTWRGCFTRMTRSPRPA
jgi:hypothetical protein